MWSDDENYGDADSQSWLKAHHIGWMSIIVLTVLFLFCIGLVYKVTHPVLTTGAAATSTPSGAPVAAVPNEGGYFSLNNFWFWMYIMNSGSGFSTSHNSYNYYGSGSANAPISQAAGTAAEDSGSWGSDYTSSGDSGSWGSDSDSSYSSDSDSGSWGSDSSDDSYSSDSDSGSWGGDDGGDY